MVCIEAPKDMNACDGQIGPYCVERQIYQTRDGIVAEVSKSGHTYILKTGSIALIRREIDVMTRLGRHHNIVTLFESFETPKHNVIILEKLEMDLITYLLQNEPCECKIRDLFKQMCSGIHRMHSQKIVHMDVSPENILLNATATQVKICDFGISLVNPNDQNHSNDQKRIGKHGFCSPELYYHSAKCDVYKNDVYSLGVTLLVMLIRGNPYTTPKMQDSYYKIFKSFFVDYNNAKTINMKSQLARIYSDVESAFSKKDKESPVSDVADILRKTVAYEDKRFTIEEVLDHTWMSLELCNTCKYP